MNKADDENGAWLYHFWLDTEDVHAVCGALRESGGTRERATAEDILNEWMDQVREQNRISDLPEGPTRNG